MNKIILSGFALLLVVSVGYAKQPEKAADYRYIIPSDWRLLPEDPNSHESRFVSPSGDAWLLLSAQLARGEPVQAHMARVRQHDIERITYERDGQTWIVVSGYVRERIFYRKAMLACDGEVWHHLAFEYPAVEKLAFDELCGGHTSADSQPVHMPARHARRVSQTLQQHRRMIRGSAGNLRSDTAEPQPAQIEFIRAFMPARSELDRFHP